MIRISSRSLSAVLVEGSKIHLDSSLVDADASLNSVRELDDASLAQIRQADATLWGENFCLLYIDATPWENWGEKDFLYRGDLYRSA